MDCADHGRVNSGADDLVSVLQDISSIKHWIWVVKRPPGPWVKEKGGGEEGMVVQVTGGARRGSRSAGEGVMTSGDDSSAVLRGELITAAVVCQ
ncbi:hypothetical protein Pcinc_042637 [Petrolisthes cinctipes]|uniref:Uncharacterized protein n=1 Tax=Petrolisthes cinctipes TaxID=88211 RepID=A0AAE1BIC4_PETCI|nr:hypothetical protein Pcinc_042637 [Petrolisthes cinctipes]